MRNRKHKKTGPGGLIGRSAALALINERLLKTRVDQGLIETGTMINTLGRGREKQGFDKVSILTELAKRSQKFDGVYPDGRVNLTKAAKDSGLTRSFLSKSVFRNCCYLKGGGTLPYLWQKPPAGSRHTCKQEATVLPVDVTNLKRKIAEAHREADLDLGKDWEDLQDLAGRFGMRIGRLGPILCDLRAPTDCAKRIWRRERKRSKKTHRLFRRVWLYRISLVKEELARISSEKEELARLAARSAGEANGATRASNTKRNNKRGPDKTPRTREIEDYCLKLAEDNPSQPNPAKRVVLANKVRERYQLAHFPEGNFSVYAARAAKRKKHPWPIPKNAQQVQPAQILENP